MTVLSLQPTTAPGPFSIVSALDARVAAEYQDREPDGYWHPSALFGCLRQAIYASRGTEVTDVRDDRSKRVLRVGHHLHEYIQKAVNDDPRVEAAFDEVKVTGLGMTGSLDHVVVIWTGPEPRWGKGGDPWMDVAAGLARVEICEYKTINSKAFKYKDLPKADHVGQLSTYLLLLKQFGGIAGDGTVIPPTEARGRIAYVSKDDLLVDEYTVLLTPSKERTILSRIDYLNRYAADDAALPPRLPDEEKKGKTQRAFLCNYCPYRQKCWDTDGPGVNLIEGDL
jgi:hypothetical protein